MVYILLGKGFEEAEALVTADVLRRGNLPVSLVGIGGRIVTGAHGISVMADDMVEDILLSAGDMVLLPGGMGGVESMEHSVHAMALAREAAQRDDLWLAAICAAPTLLARHNLIGNGQKAVCYPGMENLMLPAGVMPCMDAPAVRDGKLITGKGPGTVYDFALLILETLADSAAAHQIRSGLHYNP